ncbi:MAG: F0F1 ATP synthase subunit B [Cyanobacteria bacterium]|nr:F0F1 ATP synthase subunit B [Cyanobacteriota bacterium]
MTSLTAFVFASHGTFGLNLDPFQTNIINLAIVIAILLKFLPGFLGGILQKRREVILADLQDAEEGLSTATAALVVAQEELSSAQAKADQIRLDGKARAKLIRLDSEQRTIQEMALLRQGADSDLNAEVSRVREQLRREAARLAIEKALASLPGRLDQGAQSRLIDQSISNLGNA